MLMVAPRSPPTIPREMPKLGPMPLCIAGTMARTRMPYIAQRRRVSLMRLGMLRPRGAAEQSRMRKKATMMRWGRLILASTFLNQGNKFSPSRQ